MTENTKKLGKAIYNYFKERTSENDKFKLCIDEYTYRYCAYQAGLTDEDIDKLLKGEGFDRIYEYDNYAFLAIVALEIKIAYDIETESELINSYNNRLIDKLSCFEDNNSLQKFYKDYQDKIWQKAKELFKNAQRNLDIPVQTTGTNRYVQYPKSQRIINGTSIIKYADKFIKLHLEPNSCITYDFFNSFVFDKNEHADNEMIRKMIFSFYCIWDGRSYADILDHKRGFSREHSSKYLEQKAKEDFFIQLEPELKFYLNKKNVDSVPDKYLWSFDTYQTKKAIFFLKDNDYNDWIPALPQQSINADEEILLLTKQDKFPHYIEEFIDTGEVEKISAGTYTILILTLNKRESFKNFNISIKAESDFELVGGIKSKRNTYYSFALPVIKFNEHKRTYESVFIDSKEYSIKDGFVDLPKNLEPGEHCIKLLDSWKSSSMFFYIEENINNGIIPDSRGWILSEKENVCSPSDNVEKTTIDGLKLLGNLEMIERKTILSTKNDDNNLRPFLKQIKRLENRFEINRNTKLNKGERYGN